METNSLSFLLTDSLCRIKNIIHTWARATGLDYQSISFEVDGVIVKFTGKINLNTTYDVSNKILFINMLNNTGTINNSIDTFNEGYDIWISASDTTRNTIISFLKKSFPGCTFISFNETPHSNQFALSFIIYLPYTDIQTLINKFLSQEKHTSSNISLESFKIDKQKSSKTKVVVLNQYNSQFEYNSTNHSVFWINRFPGDKGVQCTGLLAKNITKTAEEYIRRHFKCDV